MTVHLPNGVYMYSNIIMMPLSLINRYFQNLVASFEAKMELYRRQIEELESHLSAISAEAAMSPQSKSVLVCMSLLA